MEKLLQHKNKIIVGISILLAISFSVFIFSKFFFEKSFKTNIDFQGNTGKYGIIKNELYIFNSKTFTRYGENGKIKNQKDISNSGNVKIGNDVIYSLNGSELIIYNTNFEEVKKIEIEDKNPDFFIENKNIILVSDVGFTVFDSTLNKLYEKKTNGNVIYAKFSEEGNKLIYTDYFENKSGFKTRFNIVDYKSDKNLNGFTFFNELIFDMGFLNKNSEDLYMLTNEKLYLFNGNAIKKSQFISQLKDFKYENGNIYLLSDKLEIFNRDLKVEKNIKLEDAYDRINILGGDVILSNSSGYIRFNSKGETEKFSEKIMDVIQNESGLYFVLENGYMKIK